MSNNFIGLDKMINSGSCYKGKDIKVIVANLMKNNDVAYAIKNFYKADFRYLEDNVKYYLKGNTKCFHAYRK